MGAADSLKSLSPPTGTELQLFASEPMIVNPISVDVDTYGRVWVTEGVNYRKNVAKPPDNKIKVLEDTDGDGRADKMTVFTSDLNASMSVCVAGSKIYVAESPNLYVYEDKNNDLKPDGPRKVLLTGFGGKNHDHGLHGLTLGPDHKLYMTCGDSGYDVTGPDGKRIQFKWGGMIRCELDGTNLEQFAVNFRNPFELAVDSFGNVWCSDNDNDGLKSVRICWILEGGNYGWFGGPEMITNPDGSFDPIHHWRADKPGFVPYALITGFGSPAGMTFYEGTAFGPQFQNRLVHCDPGPREVRLYTPKRLPGIGFSAGAENIITGKDGYFRPIDPCVAPDGSIYVTDWYDGGVGGHAYNDPTRGRIYRIVPKERKLARDEKPGPYTTDEDALQALASPNLATAYLARERLIARGESTVKLLSPYVVNTQPIETPRGRLTKARAMWVLDQLGGAAQGSIVQQLQSHQADFRALAVRILRRHGSKFADDILKLANDADGEVRKEVLLAAGALNTPAADAIVLAAYGTYDGRDRYLLETLGIASHGREAEYFAKLIPQNEPADVRRVSIVRLLHPPEELSYLSKQLAAKQIPAETQEALLAALADLPSVDAGLSIARFVARDDVSPTIRRGALTILKRNLGSRWQALKTNREFQKAIAATLNDRKVAADALSLIGSARLTQYTNEIGRLISNPGDVALTLAAIDAAAKLGMTNQQPHIAKLLKSDDASLRDGVLQALVTLGDTKTLGALLADKEASGPSKERAVDLLSRTSDGAIYLLRLIDTKKLSPRLTGLAIAAAVTHPDVNVRLLYQKYIPADKLPKTLGQAFKPDDILKLKGDELRGQNIFLRSSAAQCVKCHRVRGRGGDIGPDLTQIGRKFEKRALLETIMNPSAGIAPEYVPYVVETTAGKAIAGFLKEESADRIVIKSIDGTQVTIPRSEIEEITKQTVSLMPELVLQTVTAQDAADLLAFMSGLQNAMAHATQFKLLGPFPHKSSKDRDYDFGPEKLSQIDASQPFSALNGQTVTWKSATAEATVATPGMFDLRKAVAESRLPDTHSIYYTAVVLDSPTAQPAVLHVGSDDGIQIWLNGKKVHDVKNMRKILAAEDQVPVSLKQGKNLLLLKTALKDGPGRLTLSAEARGSLSFTVP